MITLGFNQQTGRLAKRPQPKMELFLSMCQNVAAFMTQHDGSILKAFISHESRGSLRRYLMTETTAYDFDLSGKLAEFAAPYIERGLLNSVTLLPRSSPEELTAFFDPSSAVRIESENA